MSVDWSMVEKNIGLVYMTANRFASGGCSGDEYLGEAALGCLRASQMFDESKARYSTYAWQWSSQRITRAIGDEEGVLRLPEHTRKEMKIFRAVQSRLAHEMGRFPTEDEVLDAMGETGDARERIPYALKVHGATIERERIGQVNKAASEPNAIDEVIRLEEAEILRRAMSKLKDIHRESLELRFGLAGNPPLSFEEIARVRGCTYQNAQQLTKAAMGRLRTILEEEGMDDL